jgi:hypothetical protein
MIHEHDRQTNTQTDRQTDGHKCHTMTAVISLMYAIKFGDEKLRTVRRTDCTLNLTSRKVEVIAVASIKR